MERTKKENIESLHSYAYISESFSNINIQLQFWPQVKLATSKTNQKKSWSGLVWSQSKLAWSLTKLATSKAGHK